MKRDAASIIFRTVVVAGAMLGAPACGGKKAPQAPAAKTEPAMEGAKKPDTKPTESAPADGSDPCAGGERPRGTDNDGGGGMGRGFILS